MEQVKFYSSKSNAKRAAQKAGINLETAELKEDGNGGFAYVAPVAPVAPVETEATDPHGCGHTHCPECGINLDNGVTNFEGCVDAQGSFQAAFKVMKHEWSCLACGAEWGARIKRDGSREAAKGTGIKIEKNREERNGVKRPSLGGACRAIWDACDAYQAAEGKAPSVKAVKEMAEVKGWNPNNASIEYYLWRKFNGIRGRQ